MITYQPTDKLMEVITKLQTGGGKIIRCAADSGSIKAQHVIDMYGLLHRCPEYAAETIFLDAYEDWLASLPLHDTPTLKKMAEQNKYSVLVVDPPWSYGSDTGRTRTAEFHYQTLGNNGKEVNRKTGTGIESIIKATPVGTLSDADAHLYMWTTNPKLPFSFDIVKAWGFEYKTTITWVKTTREGGLHRGGMGWFFRGATEHVLFAVRGHKPIPSSMRKPNVVLATPTEHSEKPTAFYDLVRSLYPTEERMVDLYGRRKHDRFDSWGDEAQ